MKGLRFFYGYTSHEFHVHPLKINVKQFIKTHNLCQSSDFDKGFFIEVLYLLALGCWCLKPNNTPDVLRLAFMQSAFYML